MFSTRIVLERLKNSHQPFPVWSKVGLPHLSQCVHCCGKLVQLFSCIFSGLREIVNHVTLCVTCSSDLHVHLLVPGCRPLLSSCPPRVSPPSRATVSYPHCQIRMVENHWIRKRPVWLHGCVQPLPLLLDDGGDGLPIPMMQRVAYDPSLSLVAPASMRSVQRILGRFEPLFRWLADRCMSNCTVCWTGC